MSLQDALIVSEMFYSIQGEGPSVGAPAVFLRLTGCNLRCLGFSYQDPKTQEHLGCDTAAVWKRGARYGFEALLDEWEKEGWFAHLQQGAHLVITGGEPLLQQPALLAFLERLEARALAAPYLEIETNATQCPDPQLCKRVRQFNVSPKLRHSGEPRQKAYQPQVLKIFAPMEHAFFKFVVANPEDVDEIEKEYLLPFAIPHQRVLLMPEGGTTMAIAQKKKWVVELCKARGFRYCTRLHIDIWDAATGV